MDEQQNLEWCKVTVDMEGNAHAVYQWDGNPISGSQFYEEDVSSWGDDDVKELFCDLIGIEGDNCDRVTVDWE